MSTKYELYRLDNGEAVSVYMGVRAHEQQLFDSVPEARTSNCHGIYGDRTKYGVRQVALLRHHDNLDGPTEQERHEAAAREAKVEALQKEMDSLGITDPIKRYVFAYTRVLDESLIAMLKGVKP